MLIAGKLSAIFQKRKSQNFKANLITVLIILCLMAVCLPIIYYINNENIIRALPGILFFTVMATGEFFSVKMRISIVIALCVFFISTYLLLQLLN